MDAAAHTPRPQLVLAPEGIIEGYCVVDVMPRPPDDPLYLPGLTVADQEKMRTVALTDDHVIKCPDIGEMD